MAWLLVIPRLLGLKRWALSLLGVIGAVLICAFVPFGWPMRVLLAWLWLGTPLVFLPWIPWRIRMRIGEPMSPAALFGDGGEARSDARLQAALVRVQAAVQSEVDRA